MSLKEKLSVVKSEEPEIYQTNRPAETENSNSTNMYSELHQIVEKMNDLATEQHSVSRKFTLMEAELVKVQKDRSELAKQKNNLLAKVADGMENLRTEVTKNQQDQIRIVKTELQSMNKEHAEQVTRTKALRQEMLELVMKFKQEQKPSMKERLMEIGLRTAVIVVLTSIVAVTLTLLLQ